MGRIRRSLRRGRRVPQLLARMFGDARLPGHIDAIYVSPDSAQSADCRTARRSGSA